LLQQFSFSWHLMAWPRRSISGQQWPSICLMSEEATTLLVSLRTIPLEPYRTIHLHKKRCDVYFWYCLGSCLHHTEDKMNTRYGNLVLDEWLKILLISFFFFRNLWTIMPT
jgi:hypothetical protein